MLKVIILVASLTIVTIMAADAVPAASPEVKEAAAGGHYGGGYGNGPSYPTYSYPNYDVNYCSVHASFPLVGLDRRHNHHHHHRGSRTRRQAYGVPAQDSTNYGSQPSYDNNNSYGNGPSYGPNYFQKPRPFDRQGCRNTAIYSQKACQRCCQVSSRAAGNTEPAVGILMVFDPKLSADKKHKKDEDLNEADRALQCVCCTSRRV